MATWLHKLIVLAIGLAVTWRCFNPATLTLPDNATYYQKQHFISGIDLTSTLFQIVGMILLGAVLLYTLPQQLPSLRKRENEGQGKHPSSQPTQQQEESKLNTPPSPIPDSIQADQHERKTTAPSQESVRQEIRIKDTLDIKHQSGKPEETNFILVDNQDVSRKTDTEDDKTRANSLIGIILTFLMIPVVIGYISFIPASDKGMTIFTAIILVLGAIIYGHYSKGQITTKDKAFKVIRNARLCFYIIALVSIGAGILATFEIIYQRELAVAGYLSGIGLIICGVLLHKSYCYLGVYPSILYASIITGTRFADFETSHQGLGLILAFTLIFLPSVRAYAATIKLQQLT